MRSWAPDQERKYSVQDRRVWAESQVAEPGLGGRGDKPGSVNPKKPKWDRGTQTRNQASGPEEWE